MTASFFDEHVAAQPDVVAELLDGPAVAPLDSRRRVLFVGIGTSLHACRVAETWVRRLSAGRIHAVAIDAHDLALGEQVHAEDQVVVVSHRGTKRYPNEVLRVAAQAGAATLTVTGQGPVEPAADVVLRTCPQEKASTHTVSYTAALTVLGRLVAATVGDPAHEFAAALRRVPAALRATLGAPLAPEAVTALAGLGAEPALITGTGLDALTAAEAALKLKEGTYRWVEGMHTEFALHGTPAAYRPGTAAFVIRPAGPDGGRSDDLRQLLTGLGAPVFSCADDEYADLPFAAVHPLVRPLVAIVPFQRLVSAVAFRVGADPDLTHLEAEPWAGLIGAIKL